MSSEGSTEKEKPKKPISDITKVIRAVNIEFNVETGEILEISDKDLKLALLESREDGSIVRLIPPVPLVQEMAIAFEKLLVDNALLKVESDTARGGWKKLQGTLEDTVREQRTTSYTTEPIQKGFWQKNAKWVFLAIVVVALLFFYFYLQAAPPRALDLGE